MVARACNPGTQEPDQGQNGLYQILDKLANSIPRKGKKNPAPSILAYSLQMQFIPRSYEIPKGVFFNLA